MKGQADQEKVPEIVQRDFVFGSFSTRAARLTVAGIRNRPTQLRGRDEIRILGGADARPLIATAIGSHERGAGQALVFRIIHVVPAFIVIPAKAGTHDKPMRSLMFAVGAGLRRHDDEGGTKC